MTNKAYEVLSVTEPNENLNMVFVILRHENGHTISGWISSKQHFSKTEEE